MENSMDWELLLAKKELRDRESGKTERKLGGLKKKMKIEL